MADAALLDEFGGFEVEIDDSAAVARAERIAAARKAGKGYSAKFDEPGWFNDPAQAARAKGAARPALSALHQAYFERRFAEAVDRGLELLQAGVKEETEVLDLVMRAALRCGREREERVLGLARRWREFPNLPSLSFISARILAASSPLSPSPTASIAAPPAPQLDAAEPLAAALASLRLHPSLPAPRALLASLLSAAGHAALARAVDDPRRPGEGEGEGEGALEREVQALEGLLERERETLRRVIGLGGQAEKDEEEGVGRDVRSL
ncbi:hypothetical protein JCM10449v2_007520 [Rhodotorula kratochvilovae]